ncbi:MAG: phage tail protein [Actinomycetota bacterium]|nr:phage tail protein [Actinomycetota bacterium]
MANGDGAAQAHEYAVFPGHFAVEVGNQPIGSFREVSGLSAEMAVEELMEGGNNRYVHKLPGQISWPNIVLTRGVTSSTALFDWFTSTNGMSSGQPDTQTAAPPGMLTRSTAQIILRDAAGTRVRTWSLRGAFPVRWTGPTLATSSTDVAVEELEIAHHGFG